MTAQSVGCFDLPLFAAHVAGCAFQRHSDTSRAAAVAATPGAATQRATIMALFQRRGVSGLTDDEIETITGYQGSAVRPRRIKLAQDGLIVPFAGVTRPTRAGRAAQVWRLK